MMKPRRRKVRYISNREAARRREQSHQSRLEHDEALQFQVQMNKMIQLAKMNAIQKPWKSSIYAPSPRSSVAAALDD